MAGKISVYTLFCLILLLLTQTRLSAQQTVSYSEAITRIAVRFEDKLTGSAPIAIVRFDSSSPRFSNRITDDLTEVFINDGKKVVDRKNLEDIMREHNFQMSGYVSDESAVGIGKMLGAQSIIIGSGENMVDYYRVQFKMLSVETAEVQGQLSQNVRYDSSMRRLLNNKTANDSSIGNTHFAVGARVGTGVEINTAHSDMIGDEDPLPKEESTAAFNAVLFLAVRFNDRFGIQPEINIMANNGIKATYLDGSEVSAAYTSLDIPIILYYNIILEPILVRISVGPYIAIPVGKINVEVGGLSGAAGIENSGVMWGIVGGFGVGFKVGPGNITGDFRYINDFNENPILYKGQEMKGFLRRSINLTVGYELAL
ncbi:hypothetical protein FACS1894124_7490 [Spirochaetia bacterium]|nr:hypothetical protein FACS1894124_7490 [Spirochaetia bacterium]